jgi:hypothetical protein
MPLMTSDILNANQRRHYHVLLTMLAQSAGRLAEIASPRHTGDSPFLTYDNDLPADFAARIAPHLDALRATLDSLAQRLDMRSKRVSRRNAVRAILVTDIVRLEDSMARGLRGYGQVDNRVRDVLDPMLQALVAELQAMRRILEG